jgi:hypothetical protein
VTARLPASRKIRCRIGGYYCLQPAGASRRTDRPDAHAATGEPRSGTSPRAASAGGARQTINQRPFAGGAARQPAAPRPQLFKVSAMDHRSAPARIVVSPAVKQQRRRRVPVPPHRVLPPLRALGRAPRVPGPVAAGDGVDRPNSCRVGNVDRLPLRVRVTGFVACGRTAW